MIFLKTDEEIELMRAASLLVGDTLAEVAKSIQPGVTTLRLDKIAEQFIRDNKAVPLFLGYNGFPNSLCISVNDQIVHGIPSEYELREGDIVSIDCGTKKNGYCGDSAYTFCIGEVSPEVQQLLKITKESLYEGIKIAVEGRRVGDISSTIQTYCEKNGYSIVRELVGHGIGKKMHEKPEVPNYGRQGNGALLKTGMCMAIEPMINMGKRNVVFEKDGWTVRTADRKPSAHFEHTVAVRRGKADILSSFEAIEKVLREKGHLIV